MQSNCIFPGRFAPFINYDWHRGHEYAITSCSITMSPPIYTIYNKYAAFSLLAKSGSVPLLGFFNIVSRS